MMLRKAHLTVWCIVFCLTASSQFEPLIKNILSTDTFNTDHPREKLFLHYDRAYYNVNDTMWLKGYLLSAKDGTAADSSRIAYIEIFNSAGELIKRISTPASSGILYANIRLNKKDFPQGTYWLRAYTNFMRNYGDSLFYLSSFTVIDTSPDNARADKTAQLKIRAGDHSPIFLPVAVNDTGSTDLQFMPEGGSFIAHKLQRVGFKAINSFGKGMDVKGKIVNSKQEFITAFSSVHNGMGIVSIRPELNEQYTAVLDNGQRFPLPLVSSSGTQLQITDDADSIAIMIDASPDGYQKDYFFRASAKGITCAMGTVKLTNQPYRFSIAKKAFPSGICRFTLYNDQSLPVNERAVLVWHYDTLRLTLDQQNKNYYLTDSVHYLLTAKDEHDRPIVGSFSVAVIDTGRTVYPMDAENILSYMILSSDLKGTVEAPAYYFGHPEPEAVDALLLTQGWVQYNTYFTQPSFSYEKEFSIHGKVVNLVNKPVANTDITLFGKQGRSDPYFLSAESDANGNFCFTGFPVFYTDSADMLIRAVNKKGRSFGIALEVESPPFPPFHAPVRYPVSLSYENQVTQTIQQQLKRDQLFNKEKGYLEEVVLTSKLRIPGSKNLNPDGGADHIITRKVLEKTPKRNLLDILRQEIPGFNKGPLTKTSLQAYKVNGAQIIFVIDGYNLLKSYDPVSESNTAYTEYEESILQYITAEEVAGIEIMDTKKYSFAYEKYYNMVDAELANYVFIEITTFSGHGLFDKKIPGMYLCKPLVPVIGRTFYSPRYNRVDKDAAIDTRPTVFWKPDIITNEKGEADFSFYTSAGHSSYLIIVQGTDLNGGLGFFVQPLAVSGRQ